MAEIHKVLDQSDPPEFRSWALWGQGGIGKTQTALAYAYHRVEDGVKAVFWVKSETALDIGASFTDIAVALNLDGAEAGGNHDQNRFLVTKWLQQTSECGQCIWVLSI